MYSLSDKEKQLGLGEKGITKYFTPNCDSTDSDLVNKYLKTKNIEGLNVFFPFETGLTIDLGVQLI